MDLKKLIREALLNYKSEQDCGCGCKGTAKCFDAPILNENLKSRIMVTENMQYHIDNKKPLIENTFRYGSKAFLELWSEARHLYSRNLLDVYGVDKEIITESHLGEYGIFEGQKVPLDLIMEEMEEELDEAKKAKKKNPPLNKPHRGGSKKFYVYVRKPGGGIKKVSFGDTSGLSAKINNPKARQAFAKRHDCANKKDKTKASYWSCRLPRYAKLLGIKSNFTGFW
jgi:hypothetical protein